MYYLNPLNRKVLIMPSEVIFHTDISKDPDIKNILAAIIIAEERFIKKFICKDLYEDFRSKKNVLVTADNLADLTDKVNTGISGPAIELKVGNMVNSIELLTNSDEDTAYKNLWNEYLWKICAECVHYTSLPNRWLQSKAAGEMLNSPSSIASSAESQSADLKSVQWKTNKILMDRIEPLLEPMKEWMCDNKASFTKFNCYKDCPEVAPDDPSCNDRNRISNVRKTPWVSGVYDDQDYGDRRRNYNSDNY